MDANEVNQVKQLVDDALKVHIYELHKRRRAQVFVPPTPAELHEYANNIGLLLAVETFYDYYATRGWTVGKNNAPMQDWRAAARKSVREGWARCTLPPKTLAEQGPKESIQVATQEQRRAIAMQNAKLAEKLKPTGIGHSQRVFEARRQANLNKLARCESGGQDLVNKLKRPPMKLTGEPVQADFDAPEMQMDESERWEQG